MQIIKDSFYMALRERLSRLNPDRTIQMNGTEQPAILVAENEQPTHGAPLADCFYVRFGACRVANGQGGADSPLLALDCSISYATRGRDSENARGRTLGALDADLMAICNPPNAALRDFTTAPTTEIGDVLFWTRPELGEVTEHEATLTCSATLTLFFSSEEQA